MCLAIPGRLTRIHEAADGTRSAEVEYTGLSKIVSLLYLPEAREGDFILVQAGFGIRTLTEAQAREVLDDLASEPSLTRAPAPAPGAT